MPLIADGSGFTVTGVVIIQPVDNAYVIVVVPANTPLTTPVPPPTVATKVLLLVHAPNPVASDKEVVKPAQTFVVPVIAAGNGFTVTNAVMTQPVGRV